MMTGIPPTGSFQLKQGVRLIQAPEGGVLLQSNPLRALKINQAALEILGKCRNGLQMRREENGVDCKKILPFLDTFVQAGLLVWVPDPMQAWPMVSVVIPVYNRPLEIEACLASLESLDYPSDRVEVIVVDDASRDRTPAMVRRFNARLIIQPHNLGQSAARNAGVAAARGEIIAFLDSDCTARSGWLRELVPYFQDPRVALVGGRVEAFYHEKRMDRYEQVCSALDMGPEAAMGRGNRSVFYVPTCNVLVRKHAYEQVGGLDDSLHVGEDVDLCWRLMAAKHHLLYQPRGDVRHKHRNRMLSGFLRRFDYGTSEAVLYARFPKVRKQFPWQPAGLGVSLAAVVALVARSWLCLVVMAGILAVETGWKRRQLRRKLDIRISVAEILAAELKGHFDLAYHLAFYLIRYHLLVLTALILAVPSQAWLGLAVILLPTLVTYLRKRPRLSFPVFAYFYLAEHAFYQCGAFWGCLKQKSFRLYRISFRQTGFVRGSKPPAKCRSITLKQASEEAVIG